MPTPPPLPKQNKQFTLAPWLIGAALVVTAITTAACVWLLMRPADFGPAEAVLRDAGVPTTTDDWIATLPAVPEDQNAAGPFLDAMAALPKEDESETFELLASLNEFPPMNAIRSVGEVDEAALIAALDAEIGRTEPEAAGPMERLKELLETGERPAMNRSLDSIVASVDDFDAPFCATLVRLVAMEQRDTLELLAGTESLRYPMLADFGVDYANHDGPLIGVLLPHLGPSRRLSKLLRADALASAADGDFGAAITRVHQMTSLAEANASAGQTLVELLVAIGLQRQASETLREILRHLPGDASDEVRAQLQSLADRLANEEVLWQSYERAYTTEAVLGLDSCRYLDSGEGDVEADMGINFNTRNLGTDARLLTEMYVEMFAAARKPDAVVAEQAITPDMVWEARSEKAGAQVALVLQSRRDGVLRSVYQSLADRRALRVLVALKLHGFDHDDKLPETLDALVPSYLDAVPIDPTRSGGKPIAYDPARGIIWTAGENRTDDGGTSVEELLLEQPDESEFRLKQQADEVYSL